MQRLYPGIWKLFRFLPDGLRRSAFFLLGLSVLSGLSEAITIGSSLPLILALINPHNFEATQYGWITQHLTKPFSGNVEKILELFALAVIISAFLRIMLIRQTQKFAQRAGQYIGQKCFLNILCRPYEYHLTQASNQLISLATHRISAVVNQVLLPSITLCSAITIGFIAFSFLLLLDPKIAILMGLLLFVTYVIVGKFSKSRIQELGAAISLHQANSIEAIQDGLGNIREITLSSLQPFYEAKFARADSSFRKLQSEFSTISLSKRYIVETIAILLMIGLGFSLINFTDSRWALVILGVYALAAQRILPLLHQCYLSWSNLQNGQSALCDVLLILATTPKSQICSNAIMPSQQINLNQISFRYPGSSRLIFEHQSLCIAQGERVAIMGQSGSGKTTLLDLLAGLLLPQSGQLTIDHMPLTLCNRQAWQKSIGYVPQQIFIHNQTIAENIAIGLSLNDIDLPRLKSAAKLASIDQFVDSLPDGFLTICGENGIRLSGGQRQRLGIARALYANKPVLMLDEPTSALDLDSEAEIIETIRQLGRTITVIVITHRISLACACDRVLSIKNGIICDLSRDELVAKTN